MDSGAGRQSSQLRIRSVGLRVYGIGFWAAMSAFGGASIAHGSGGGRTAGLILVAVAVVMMYRASRLAVIADGASVIVRSWFRSRTLRLSDIDHFEEEVYGPGGIRGMADWPSLSTVCAVRKEHHKLTLYPIVFFPISGRAKKAADQLNRWLSKGATHPSDESGA